MERKASEIIEDFLNLIDDCAKKYDWAYEQVGIEDQRTVDLMHGIEFEEDGRKRTQIATKLHNCRKDRRAYKDIVELTYIVNYWSERNEHSINYLREMLGRVREKEEYFKTRTYTPRVEEELWSEQDM